MTPSIYDGLLTFEETEHNGVMVRQWWPEAISRDDTTGLARLAQLLDQQAEANQHENDAPILGFTVRGICVADVDEPYRVCEFTYPLDAMPELVGETVVNRLPTSQDLDEVVRNFGYYLRDQDYTEPKIEVLVFQKYVLVDQRDDDVSPELLDQITHAKGLMSMVDEMKARFDAQFREEVSRQVGCVGGNVVGVVGGQATRICLGEPLVMGHVMEMVRSADGSYPRLHDNLNDLDGNFKLHAAFSKRETLSKTRVNPQGMGETPQADTTGNAFKL